MTQLGRVQKLNKTQKNTDKRNEIGLVSAHVLIRHGWGCLAS